jgi:oligopeptide/dipeptide ABC transporter ATP-binding protein
MTTPLVEVSGLAKRFPVRGGGYIGAVNDVSFSIGRGETLGLVGESGSGKTTVGRCLLRLIEPTAGTVRFDGVDLTALPPQALRRLRPRAQLVFQDPFASLNPRRSTRQAIEEPLTLHTALNGRDRRDVVMEMVGRVGLSEDDLQRYPAELTASEQQRVGIARALVTQPSLIVLDEPTSMLDPVMRADILDVLADLQASLGISYLFISHDLTAVERLSHRIAVMYLGRLVEIAPTGALLSRQDHPYTRALLSAVLHVDPTRPLPQYVVEGEIPSALNPRDECPFAGRCPLSLPACRERMPPMRDMGQHHQAACVRADELRQGVA